MSNSTTPAAKPSRSVMFGAAFLMATSAIGPGFLTQTSKFTATYGSNLIGVILLVICMDIIAQMNIWSVVSVSGMRAQDVANKVLPGLGYVVAVLRRFVPEGRERIGQVAVLDNTWHSRPCGAYKAV